MTRSGSRSKPWSLTSPTVLCCSWGGLLVAKGLMPLGVLISGLGFTFSLTYATQVRDGGRG